MRVYVPCTVPGLADLARTGRLGDRPVTAYAVTPAVRAAVAWADEEEAEYAVLQVAADAALDLLRADPDAPDRRVVVAAEADPAAVQPLEGAAVRLVAPPPLARLAALLVDDPAAAGTVRAARDGTGPGDLTDLALQWYAPQELAALLTPDPSAA